MANTTNSRWIRVETNDGSFDAYLSLPPAGKQAGGPGIVLIQEIFGVNEHIRSVADQYASDGYVVLAPDIFWRQSPRVELGYAGADMEQAFALRKATDVDAAVSDIAATVRALRAELGGQGKVAAVGYCFGGLLSYLSAARGLVDAAVPYYGGGIHANLREAPRLNVPAQFHFGALDAHITLDQVADIRAAVEGKADTEVFVYEKADHGFNCWARGSYHQPSAALAHGRALAFLSEHLS
ncbi:dienelactone hydrolase family protein [Cupriavidus plantarum]|uniref:Carboxymethylenebutenolidase n=1 Tax=Cupriavidus plantarum TaxID=942865 RepID=A0A316EIT3_9BURK|nr:dienelactone hydrolase family protein [Cupriavidus plantarum]NYI01342.1 carboxymethylenebutenolidase [Cupriavidus plantarum]PWK31336.1 carboxymethylenebutenolidase [Cupriavidus plantarum]RLK39608.1 carboxymethylenebutenolidase [Cupriavidus plantarum]CAG2154274.1 Carboxymethylenebutenolidase [Cupriavidus plantarum]SMR86824.1 carboxymethylenebutenolidase [Cupriavidus plantarum]